MSEKILSKTNNSKFLSAPHIPYKGNRAAIAQQLCEAMPPCNHFLDACCGGASVGLTMLAMGYPMVSKNYTNRQQTQKLEMKLILCLFLFFLSLQGGGGL